MRRILSLFLALTLVFALVACSNEKNTSSDIDTSTHNTTQSDTESTDDTSTESNESGTTDENSSDTETSKPTSSKPTTNSNNNTQTSKPTESSKPTQSTTGNNSSNNNTTNNNNNSNNSNNSSNNSTTTPPVSKPEEIEYCNESLIIERNFTPEKFLSSVMDFYNNNEFESYSPHPDTEHVAAFGESDLANGFAKFDIFGYELASTNYPLCDFSVSRDGNQNFIKFSSFSINKSCTFKTEADVVRALKRDIDKFTRFLGDLGCSYYYCDKTTMQSVSSFTDDMILSIAKGNNTNLKIKITAENTFNFGNDETRFSASFKCTKIDNGYLYSFTY